MYTYNHIYTYTYTYIYTYMEESFSAFCNNNEINEIKFQEDAFI